MNSIKEYDAEIKGKDYSFNLPKTGKATGYFLNDLMGTWYEIEEEDGTKFWVIGETRGMK